MCLFSSLSLSSGTFAQSGAYVFSLLPLSCEALSDAGLWLIRLDSSMSLKRLIQQNRNANCVGSTYTPHLEPIRSPPLDNTRTQAFRNSMGSWSRDYKQVRPLLKTLEDVPHSQAMFQLLSCGILFIHLQLNEWSGLEDLLGNMLDQVESSADFREHLFFTHLVVAVPLTAVQMT